MNYKQKADQIRFGIVLIKDKSVSNFTKEKKLGEIAELCEMYNYSDTLSSNFTKKSLKMQKLNKQVEWTRYFRSVLEGLEQYELLHELKTTLT